MIERVAVVVGAAGYAAGAAIASINGCFSTENDKIYTGHRVHPIRVYVEHECSWKQRTGASSYLHSKADPVEKRMLLARGPRPEGDIEIPVLNFVNPNPN